MISINVYEIVMQIINFCILWALISKFLVKPLGEFLKNRADSIKDDLESSEHNKIESEKLLDLQKEAFATARKEIKQLRLDAEQSVKLERSKVLAQAKCDSEKIVEDANKQILQNVEEVKRGLLSETTHLVVGLTKKILKREVNSSDQKALVAEALGQK